MIVLLGLRETVALCVSYSCMAADNPSAVRQCPSNRFIVYGKWAPDTKTFDPQTADASSIHLQLSRSGSDGSRIGYGSEERFSRSFGSLCCVCAEILKKKGEKAARNHMLMAMPMEG